MIMSGPDFIYNIASDSKDVTQTSLELSYFIYAFIFYNCGLIVALGFGYKHSNSTFTFLSVALTFISLFVVCFGIAFLAIVRPSFFTGIK